MTHCTVCFHNIMWFHLKVCIKNCGFLFWTINIRKVWSHHKSNEMKCNKVSKNIKWYYLAHTSVFPSLFFFYSVWITSSTFKDTLRNDWGTPRCFSEPIEPSTHQSSRANGIRKVSNPWKCMQGRLHQPLGSSTTHLKPSWIVTVQLLKPQILETQKEFNKYCQAFASLPAILLHGWQALHSPKPRCHSHCKAPVSLTEAAALCRR